MYISDWLRTTDYQPEQNATWNGLLRRAEEWHRAEYSKFDESWEDVLAAASTAPAWQDPLGNADQTIEGDISVRPLLSPASLIQEGIEMDHCLKWDFWRQECEAGNLWCYSLTLISSQERSTLAIRRRGTRFTIEQHQSRHNTHPCEPLQRGAQILLDMIRQSLGSSEKKGKCRTDF